MITLIMYNNLNGTDRYETVLNCTSFDIQEKKINYLSTRSLNGKKRQSWDGTYKTFSFSFKDVPENIYQNLKALSKEQLGDTYLIHDNDFYVVDIESDSFSVSKTQIKTDESTIYIYSGSIQLEETTGGDS